MITITVENDKSGTKARKIVMRYDIRATDAPKEYDGFGTVELWASKGDDGKRVVAIRCEHLAWQTGRYESGRHRVDVTEQYESFAIDKFITRAYGT